MSNSRPTIDFIWKITNDVLWNTFRKNELGEVMLPFIVLRRLDCVFEPQKKEVRKTYLQFIDKVKQDQLHMILLNKGGYEDEKGEHKSLSYYNTSQYDLKGLTQDPDNIEINFHNYINGFSQNVVEIMDNFQLDKVVARLVKNNLLYELVEGISQVDLHINKVSNHDMGYVFEEIIRVSNEQSNETAGEHFTPRDVIRLMVNVMFSTELDELKKPGIIRTIYDLACGTGGMLIIAKDYIHTNINKDAVIEIYGQEINEQSYAIAKSDLMITGENPNNIKLGNSFTRDKFTDIRFNYMLANPPYGVSWKKDETFIKNEALNPIGRFSAGLPRTSDGQLMFLQHMISKMEPKGSKIAVVTNGSPLFTGDARSGESEIRKWIITNDWLEAIIALPSELFYNTGIFTYIWIVSNKKSSERKGKVQLINGIKLFMPLKRSLNNKRKEVSADHIKEIVRIYKEFEENGNAKIFDNDHFGYYQVTVEQPLMEDGKIVMDKKGNPKVDGSKRDKENIHLSEDIEEYFEREVKPHLPDAWIDFSKTRIGYEINFTSYFYEFKELRPLEEIQREIMDLERETDGLLKSIMEL